MDINLEYLKETVRKGNLNKFFEELKIIEIYYSSEIEQMICELERRYNKYISDSNKGILTYEEETISCNKINSSALHLILKIAKEPLKFQSIESIRKRANDLLNKYFQNENGHFYKKYINEIYEERTKAHNLFHEYTNQIDKRCFIITGKAGKGKTTLFCKLVNHFRNKYTKNKMSILLDSSSFRLNEKVTLRKEIEKRLDSRSLEEVGEILQKEKTKLFIFLDAINELEGDDVFNKFSNQLSELMGTIKEGNYPILFCISCRSDFWFLFQNEMETLGETFKPENGGSQNPTYELGDFPEDRMDEIIKKYFKWFGLEGIIEGQAKEQCKNPLMLRYLCEAYTERESNNREPFSSKKIYKYIGIKTTLRKKEIFDIFVDNIQPRISKRLKKILGEHNDESLFRYTTTYLIHLSKVMFEKRRTYISTEEVLQVAKELNHPDQELNIEELESSSRSVFYMFIDEGLILDKAKKNQYHFIFESYFEYSLGRYIAYNRWGKYEEDKYFEIKVKEDLVTLFGEHDSILRKNNFTNLLGAIQYAILTVEKNNKIIYPEGLFLDLIEVMLKYENATFIYYQKAFSTLRMTKLLHDSEKKYLTYKMLGILRDFVKRSKDFVISWDLETTLLQVQEFALNSKILIEEMKEWAGEEGNIVLQLNAVQILSRIIKTNPIEVIEVIGELEERIDYRSSFWLGRTLIFAISEAVMDVKSNALKELSTAHRKQLWIILEQFIKDKETSIHIKDLAFSVLPYIFKGSYRYIQEINKLISSNLVSKWGIWNLVYELQNWKEEDLSWIRDFFNQLISIDDPHLNYIIDNSWNKLLEKKLDVTQELRLKKQTSNSWRRYVISQKRGFVNKKSREKKTGIVYSPIYLEPSYDNHIECRQRLQAIISKLLTLEKDCFSWVQPFRAREDQLRKVHTGKNDRHRDGTEWTNYYEEVQNASDLFKKKEIKKRKHTGPAELRYESFETAQFSAGGTIAAVDYVMRNEANSAWSLGRPPGHLANNSICIFNNIAVGALYAKEEHGIKRILIIDCDAHHGKHTGYVFRKDPNVIYFSIHVEGSYAKEEGNIENIGEGKGKGYTFNITYPPNTTDKGYEYIVSNLLEPLALDFKPDLIMISAGFDGHFEDELNPDGSFTEHAYIHLGKRIRLIASVLNINVVGVFEGGYGLDSLANSFVHLMNEIGDWGNNKEKIGFVECEGITEDNSKIEKVKEVVNQRILLMKETKQKNPKYKLFNDEQEWAKYLT